MPVDVRSLSDEELERIIAQADTPPPHDALPGRAVDTTPAPKSTGNPAIDAALGMGDHFADSALSVGEAFRSIPGVGDALKGIGNRVADIFGLEDPGIQEAPTLEGRIADERRAAPNTAPDNLAADLGAGGASLLEAFAPMLATGGGSTAASGIIRGRGVLPALKQAAGMGLKEAATTGVTSSIQEGEFDGDTVAAMALSGAMPLVGRGLTKAKGAIGDMIGKSLLTTAPEAVKRGASAAKGLRDSGVVAGGVESLYRKLNDAAMKSTEKTMKFIRSHPVGRKAVFDRDEVSEIILDTVQDIRINDVLDPQTKKSVTKKLLGLRQEFNKVNNYASGEDLLLLRRRLGEATNWAKGEVKTAANIVKETRQKMYSKINSMLEDKIPEVKALNKADFDLLTARDAAEALLGQKQGAHNEFLVRRGVPLIAGAALGGASGYTAGGAPGAALGGLAGGAALGSPAASTALVQLLKTREGTRAAEIAARLFGLTPSIMDDDEEEENR